jgi:putative tryptophan/tyrosine transport system substrate-binding protein
MGVWSGVRAPMARHNCRSTVGKVFWDSPVPFVREVGVFEDATQRGHVAEIFDVVERTRGRPHALFRIKPWDILGRSSRIIPIAIAGWFLVANAASAQQSKSLDIGVLALGPRYVPVWHCGQADDRPGSFESQKETKPFYVLGMIDGLQKLGYVEDRPESVGKNGRRFTIHLGMGTQQELKDNAQQFVDKKFDVIVAIALAAVRSAEAATRDHPIPVVFTGVSDPVQDGFVESLARPGGNITGVSHQEVQGSAKRVELFKELLPGLHRMITLRRPGYEPSEKSMVEIRQAAERLKIEVLDWTAKDRTELKNVLANLHHETADGIMITPDSAIISNIDLVIEASFAQRVPVFGLQDYMADWGAIAAYGPSAHQAGARAAGYIDKIVKGAKPGDLPVEPTDPVLVINMKAAACLGASPPLDVLSQADRVVR